jgi:hypothetical protein
LEIGLVGLGKKGRKPNSDSNAAGRLRDFRLAMLTLSPTMAMIKQHFRKHAAQIEGGRRHRNCRAD